jgi:hypothetical protein
VCRRGTLSVSFGNIVYPAPLHQKTTRHYGDPVAQISHHDAIKNGTALVNVVSDARRTGFFAGVVNVLFVPAH